MKHVGRDVSAKDALFDSESAPARAICSAPTAVERVGRHVLNRFWCARWAILGRCHTTNRVCLSCRVCLFSHVCCISSEFAY